MTALRFLPIPLMAVGVALAAPASAAQPVAPPAGSVADSTMPTFRWTADHPGQYSRFLMTASPQVGGSSGEMTAPTLDVNANANGETSYRPVDPLDAGTAWWQVCEQAPDFSTSCFAPREVIIPIHMSSERRVYSRVDRSIRITLVGNLWRGATAQVTARGLSWTRTFRGETDSNSLTVETTRVPRRVKWVRLSGTVTAQGATHQLALARVRTR